MKQFLIALQFLTILPVKINSAIKEEDFGKSLIYFPLVGTIIGTFLAITLLIFTTLPYLVTSALISGVNILVTGGIHLDGFIDSCDGLYGQKSKVRALEIMRDSHIGAIGAIYLFVLLIIKFAIIASIRFNILWKILILMPAFGRCTQVLSCYLSKYARNEGKAKYFIEHIGKKEFLYGSLFTIIIFTIFFNIKGLILFFLSIAPIYLIINYIKKRIDGMTGDTIGAVSEIGEVVFLLFSLILLKF